MLKVFAWQADWAGCGHLRMIWPMESLSRYPEIETGHDTKINLQWQQEADVVIGQRVCQPGPISLWRKWAAEGKKKLVAELDDDLWSVEPENVRAYRLFSQPEVQDRLDEFVRLAHTVTVSTEPLAEVVYGRTGHTDIRVIPNAVPKRVTEKDPALLHTVGWTGSPTHTNDFAVVGHQLRRFLDRNPDTTFHTIGASYAETCKLPPKQVVHTPWIKDVEASMLAADYRINLAPLTASRFNRSKSDLRFIQAAALGIPTVGSGVPAHHTMKHGENAWVVRYEHEWGRAMYQLTNDAEMRTELGKAARTYVRSQRTLDATVQLWYEAVRP